MKLGIDISQIVYPGTGVSRYLNGLVRAILQYDQSNEWIFFFSSLRQNLDEKLEAQIKQKGYQIKKYKIPPTILSLMWNRLHKVNLNWFTGKLDWFITSDWTEPPAKHIKKATMVHDLAYLRYPETMDWKILKAQQSRLIHVCQESQVIFADSFATKTDLINYLNINESKIVVVYPGVEIKSVSAEVTKKVKKKFKLNKPFILSVGKLEPRKNLSNLIKAYFSLNQAKYELVIVGPKGWDDLKVEHERVRFLGYVTDAELSALYQTCNFFIFSSLWEGFGYPLVEAMSLRVPTTVANTSSLLEIGKHSSLFFDPKSLESIRQAMQRMIEDTELKARLVKKGIAAVKEYSWQQAYLKILTALINN